MFLKATQKKKVVALNQPKSMQVLDNTAENMFLLSVCNNIIHKIMICKVQCWSDVLPVEYYIINILCYDTNKLRILINI